MMTHDSCIMSNIISSLCPVFAVNVSRVVSDVGIELFPRFDIHQHEICVTFGHELEVRIANAARKVHYV